MNTENHIQTIEPAQRALATVPATPADILIYAMEKGGNIEQIEKLMDLQMRWEANEARKAYVADMAEFKKNPPTIVKDKHVSFDTSKGNTSYDHATIGNVTNSIISALAQHGFSHSWNTAQKGGQVIVTCTITHRKGHSESVTLESAPDQSGGKNGIQSIISAQTYLQRHSLLAATGLATHDQPDDDGKAALDTALADKWMRLALHAADLPALEKVWTDGEKEINASGTEHDYRDFVGAVNARKAKLTAPPRDPNKSSRLSDIVNKDKPGPQQAAE